MSRFDSARQAEELLVAVIVEEAQREGVPLSELEQKMLYFTESGWAPPGTIEAARLFDAEYDQSRYEKKISRLIRNARRRVHSQDQRALADWFDAIRVLGKGDHYLLVMIDRAGAARPPWDRLKLWATAFAIVVAVLGLFYAANRLGIPITRESLLWFAW